MYNHHVVYRTFSILNSSFTIYKCLIISTFKMLWKLLSCLRFFYPEHPNSLLALPVFAVSFSIAYLIATSIPLLIIHTMFNSGIEHNIFSSTKSLLNSNENTSLIFPHMCIFLEFIKIPCLFDYFLYHYLFIVETVHLFRSWINICTCCKIIMSFIDVGSSTEFCIFWSQGFQAFLSFQYVFGTLVLGSVGLLRDTVAFE